MMSDICGSGQGVCLLQVTLPAQAGRCVWREGCHHLKSGLEQLGGIQSHKLYLALWGTGLNANRVSGACTVIQSTCV